MAVFFLSVHVRFRLDTLSGCRSRTETWKGSIGSMARSCDVHVPGQSCSYVCILGHRMVSRQAFSYFTAFTEPLQSSAKLDKSCSGLGSIKRRQQRNVCVLSFIKKYKKQTAKKCMYQVFLSTSSRASRGRKFQI